MFSLWSRAVQLPAPVLDQAQMKEYNSNNHLLLPYDLSKPDGYQDPSEYNSLMLRALVDSYVHVLGVDLDVVLADHAIKTLRVVSRMLLYPGLEDELGRCGVLDSQLQHEELSTAEVERKVGLRMIHILGKAVDDPIKRRKMVEHIRAFSRCEATMPAESGDTVLAVLRNRLTSSKTFMANEASSKVLEKLPDLVLDLACKRLNLDANKLPEIRKVVLAFLAKNVQPRLIAGLLSEFTRVLS
jgi:hypothetical protein